MTDNQIGGYTREALAELCEKATAPPWQLCYHLESKEHDDACPCGIRGTVYGSDGEHGVCEMGSTSIKGQEGMEPPRYERSIELLNAQFIAAARTALPAALQRIAELEAALREARCWIVDGSRRTPEQRGAQCETCIDALEMIDKAL